MQKQLAQRSISDRSRSLRLNRQVVIVQLGLLALFVRVLYLIVVEYPSYFPADFDSAFLTGRKEFFHGLYRIAFYAHIISGPISLVLGLALMTSGLRGRFPKAHRRAGRFLVLLVGALVAPTGLVMATHSYTGPIAGWGFALLAIATTAFAWATMSSARQGKYQQHRIWATRLFILMCSPLLLRLFSGAVIVAQLESATTFRLSAWFSWILPLLIYETTLWLRGRQAICATNKGAIKNGDPDSFDSRLRPAAELPGG